MKYECNRKRAAFLGRSGSLMVVVGPTSMRRTLLALVFALVCVGATSAQAQTVISWADFTATQQVCQDVCTNSQWEQVLVCSADSSGQSYCYYDLQTVCVAYGRSCAQVRKPLPDGDIIDVQIEHGAVSPSEIGFRLLTGPDVYWWKEIKLVGKPDPDPWRVWVDNHTSWCNYPQAQTLGCNTQSEWMDVMLPEHFVFNKAKMFGVHTDVYVLRDFPSNLRGGDRVTFNWIHD